MLNEFTSRLPIQAREIIEQLDELLRDAEVHTKPLEVDPLRSQLFEIFVSAEKSGHLRTDSENDLSADGLCRTLSERWGLRNAAQAAVAEESKLSSQNVNRMRLLWSLMRMWMEWDYAWRRWGEYHQA